MRASIVGGTFAHFEFTVGPYASLMRSGEDAIAQFTDFCMRGLAKGTWVFESAELFDVTRGSQEVDPWASLVGRLKRIERLNSAVFLKILGVFDEARHDYVPISRGVISMRSGRSYALEFLHRIDDPVFERLQASGEQFLTTLLFSTELASPISAEQPLRGKYDLNRQHFYCLRTLRNLEAVFILAGGLEGRQNAQAYLSSVTLPMRVTRAWTRESALLLIAGIGLALGGVADLVFRAVARAAQSGASVSWDNVLTTVGQTWLDAGPLPPILFLLGIMLTIGTRWPRN
ncbi:MAG: hypothetical protein HY682_09085 [Chloroflexi bacterium]|nr:hypothetical protein [Chloroflexota bacterium]